MERLKIIFLFFLEMKPKNASLLQVSLALYYFTISKSVAVSRFPDLSWIHRNHSTFTFLARLFFLISHNPSSNSIPLCSIKCIHTSIKASSEEMYSGNKSNKFIRKGFFLSPTSHFHWDLCFPPTLSLFVLWKKSIKLSSIHIAANLILLLEISSAVRRHLSPLLALLEWPARLRGWGKGS